MIATEPAAAWRSFPEISRKIGVQPGAGAWPAACGPLGYAMVDAQCDCRDRAV